MSAQAASSAKAGASGVCCLPVRNPALPRRSPTHTSRTSHRAGRRQVTIKAAASPGYLSPQRLRVPSLTDVVPPKPPPQPLSAEQDEEQLATLRLLLQLHMDPAIAAENMEKPRTWFQIGTGGSSSSKPSELETNLKNFFKGDLPSKIGLLLLLLVVSRLGVYIPLYGVDRQAFADTLQQGGLLQYVDTLSGGSISKLGIFSLGIVPYINSSILFQLLGSTDIFPELKKMQKEEGAAGRQKFQQYQRYGALLFAVLQSVGQVLYVSRYVPDFDLAFLAQSSLSLTTGAMILMYIGEVLTELKLSNGTSLLIFTSIVSALPSSIGQTIKQTSESDNSGALVLFFGAFFLVTMGIVYVQEAERKIPIVYASRYQAGSLGKSAFLPFKVNSAGVMPIIFASSLLALPAGVARFTGSEAVVNVAKALYPGGNYYLPINVLLIAFFNYFYTFLQLDPKDVADQLKRQGAAIPSVRPGRATSQYITNVLTNISILGSVFLGALAAAPGAVEKVTGLTSFRGFAGTSILILVGVATDAARKVRSELVMQEYKDRLDQEYDEL